MPRRPDILSFDVGDTTLGALRWAGNDGAPTVLALHAIGTNAWSWDPFAHQLGGAAHVVALDMRGRGASLDAPGPYTIRQLADDVAAVVSQLGEPVLVLGHSMGGYVALMAAKHHSDLVGRVMLVNGGAPLALPPDASIDAALDELLSPMLSRVNSLWPDRISYFAMWAAHPAFADGISIDLERNLLHGLVEVEGGFRMAVDDIAVRTAGREMLADAEVRSLLIERITPTTILRAPFGLANATPPMITDEVVTSTPQHRWIDVAGTNHYTLLLGRAGAAAVAAATRRELAR